MMRTRQLVSKLNAKVDIYDQNKHKSETVWTSERPTIADLRHVGSDFKQETTDVEITKVRTMVDTEIPDFFKKKKSGEILPTNVLSVSEELISPQNSLQSCCQYIVGVPYRNSNGLWSTGTSVSQSSFLATPIKGNPYGYTQAEENDAKVLAKARLHSQGMDYLTSAAELHKTVAMLTGLKRRLLDAVAGLARAVRRVIRQRKLRITSFKELYALAESVWLEYRFGWRILYYDLQSLYEFATETAEKKFIVGRYRDKTQFERIVTSTKFGLEIDYVTREIQAGYPAVVDTSFLGFANPMNTAWDLTPFSLVLDWFFDIQSQVLALTGSPMNVTSYPDAAFITTKVRILRTTQARDITSETYGSRDVIVETIVSGSLITQEVEFVSRKKAGDPHLSWPPFVGGPTGYQRLDLAFLLRPMYQVFVGGKIDSPTNRTR